MPCKSNGSFSQRENGRNGNLLLNGTQMIFHVLSETYHLDREIQNKGVSDSQQSTLHGRLGKFGPCLVEGVRPVIMLFVHVTEQHRDVHHTKTAFLRKKKNALRD